MRLAIALLFGLGCGAGDGDDPDPPPEPPHEELPDGNPIDRVMERVFAAAGIAPVEAGRAELCRRLSADLLGYYVTADEADAECGARTLDAIVRDFQSRPDYLVVTDRRWRDRLATTDLFVNWHDVADLYERIHRAHAHQLRYDELAVEVMAHPAFLLQQDAGDERAAAVFAAFLGRTPTAFERANLANLFRTWFLGDAIPDADFPYFERYRAFVPTANCFHAASCATVLFGGVRLDMEPWRFAMPLWADIDPELRDLLGEPGRAIARDPTFWEAAADELLARYLGWSDGGRAPREPGVVLPEVRQALADYLRISGDYADAERMVVTSWLYRQTAQVDGELPVFAVGPVKPALPEVWLTTLARHTIDLGRDEPRFPDHWYWHEISQAYQRGAISLAQHNADVARLHQLQGNRMVLVVDPEGRVVPQWALRDHARSLGGAPGLGRVRQPPEGLAFALFHDAIAEALCAAAPPPASTTLPGIVDELVPKLYGRAATDGDREVFATAYADCKGADCAPAARGAAVCTALATAPEMHFY